MYEKIEKFKKYLENNKIRSNFFFDYVKKLKELEYNKQKLGKDYILFLKNELNKKFGFSICLLKIIINSNECIIIIKEEKYFLADIKNFNIYELNIEFCDNYEKSHEEKIKNEGRIDNLEKIKKYLSAKYIKSIYYNKNRNIFILYMPKLSQSGEEKGGNYKYIIPFDINNISTIEIITFYPCRKNNKFPIII